MRIKGFDKNLQCIGFQFEIGKTYDTGAPDNELKLCSDKVFHYGDSIQMVNDYYSCLKSNRYCEIEVLGKEITDGNKYWSNRIRILREIIGEELNVLKGMVNGNTGLFNTGDRNTGNWNTGLWNSCNFSNGVFCNREDDNIRIFNQPSGMSFEDFLKSEYYGALTSKPVILTEWCEYAEEEKDTEEKRITGGYLKSYSYEEAHRNWWNKLTEENKKIIQSIPNFDPEIFFDITGIDVRKTM